METTIIGYILEFYWDNGKENGSYYGQQAWFGSLGFPDAFGVPTGLRGYQAIRIFGLAVLVRRVVPKIHGLAV